MDVSCLLLLFLAATDQVSFGAGGRFQLERSSDGFGVRSHGIVEKVESNRTKLYPLPQSTADEYIRLRPEDLKRNPFTPKQYDRQEVIGPYQVENGKLWFGKQYYDSEGQRGVGAFGYFDSSTHAYTLFPRLRSPGTKSAQFLSSLIVFGLAWIDSWRTSRRYRAVSSAGTGRRSKFSGIRSNS